MSWIRIPAQRYKSNDLEPSATIHWIASHYFPLHIPLSCTTLGNIFSTIFHYIPLKYIGKKSKLTLNKFKANNRLYDFWLQKLKPNLNHSRIWIHRDNQINLCLAEMLHLFEGSVNWHITIGTEKDKNKQLVGFEPIASRQRSMWTTAVPQLKPLHQLASRSGWKLLAAQISLSLESYWNLESYFQMKQVCYISNRRSSGKSTNDGRVRLERPRAGLVGRV